MGKLISDCGSWQVYGNSSPKILIAGHSHTLSLYSALSQNEKFTSNFGVVAQTDFSTIKQQDGSYWEFVRSISNRQPTAISWNGNQHNIHFLLENKLEFNAIGMSFRKGWPVVPISQIKELFKPTFLELEQVLNELPKSTEVSLLGTVAPKEKGFLDQHLSYDTYFVNIGKKYGISKQELRASSNEIRTLMWKVTQNMTEQLSKELNCKFIPTPADTYNENYILQPKYYAQDLTHANGTFGVKMLEAIQDFYELNDV